MKAIIWKELRENFKWAALLLLAMGFAVVLIFWPTAYDPGLLGNRLLSGDCRALTAFGFCGAGWALGLVHTYRDTRRDRWAFLVHRPATLTQLFFGKVIAGLFLYLLVTAGPLVGAILWTATPGNIPAPFEWRMTLPLVADTLAGILFYLAGMIIGLRQARWFGSRILALLPAILGALAASATELSESLAWIALFFVVEMVAAWGCFISGGQYRSQPTAAKTSLGLILLISFTAISSLVFTVGVGLLAERRPGVTWDYYQTTGNGQIVHVSKTIGKQGRTILTRVEDLNGEPMPGYSIGVPGSAYVSPTVSAVVRSDRPHSGDDSYRSTNRYFRFVRQGGGFVWYYVSRKGRIEQYSEETRRPVGSIGPDGFVPVGVETTERFDGARFTRIGLGTVPQLLAYQQAVYRIDCLQGTITEILTAKPDEPILHAGDFDILYGLALGTENEFIFIGNTGDVRIRSPFEYDRETYPNVTLFMGSNRDRFYVWYSPTRFGIKRTERDALQDVIVEISDDGMELARYTIPSRLTYPSSDPPTYAGLFGSVFPIILPIVLIGYNLACVFAGSMEAHLWLEGIVREVTQMGPSFTSLFGISLLVSIAVSVLVCVVIGRRHAFSRRRIGWWCVVMVLSGPAGLLTMRALLDWPARETCPNCGKKRVVNRDLCEHCDAPFARPERDGTEIFDT